MRAVAALALALSGGCVGLPRGVEVQIGHGYGAFENSSGKVWDDDTGWVALSLQFPIYWSANRLSAALPPPEPKLPLDPTPIAAPEAKRDPPWWEDFSLVQMLALSIVTAIITKFAGPGYAKAREVIGRRGEHK